MILHRWLLLFLIVSLSGCIGVTQPIKFNATEAISKEAYAQNKSENAVVLLDVNWGRRWGCGDFENAQLISLAFDKLPLKNTSNEAVPDLVLQSPSRLNVKQRFINYAYSVPAGEYALSAISIKVAKSVRDVGFFTVQRDKLFKAGKPAGGTFNVKQGEAVFIGNFYLDCLYGPTLWRYYPDGRESFKKQIIEYKNTFPHLNLVNVRFRLFKTEEFGYNYELK